jgi:mitotic spindle assembly checkpoint protein MAD2B
MPPKKRENNFISLLQSYSDFLTVSIHTILYLRSLYPPETFITTRKYNYPVHQSRHPGLCSWITSAVDSVREELIRGVVDKIAVVIYSPYSEPLERFVFDMRKFPCVDRREMYLPLVREGEPLPQAGDINETNVNLEEQFRATLARLTATPNTLQPLPTPEECTFNIALELRDTVEKHSIDRSTSAISTSHETAQPPIRHPQPWIPVEPDLQRVWTGSPGMEEFEASEGEKLGGARTVPVRSVAVGDCAFEMWIEEGRGKNEAVEMASQEARIEREFAGDGEEENVNLSSLDTEGEL